MQLFFQNNFVKLSFDKQSQLGIAEWTGRLHGAELRESFLLCLEMINRFSLTKWLADDRRMGPITPDDLEWSLEVHVPNMAKSPLQRYAHLPSQFDTTRDSVDSMINKGHTYGLNLTLRDFKSKQEALAWLME
ncbi:hypothetical protein [Pontibacter roseus]|uniref:hypothetical protein n=1 Tax=Pontibacter roseus TaxID=336989 RepID=UPI00035C2AF3|nr:hypothetical protein [Pontibacter roseus]